MSLLLRLHTRPVVTTVVAVSISSLSLLVHADQVSGTVTVGGQPVSNEQLVFQRGSQAGITVPVVNGSYQVFLEPGTYHVRLAGRDGTPITVRSLRTPVTRNLSF